MRSHSTRAARQVIADELAAANTGVTAEIFGASELGGDADRIASVASGDIDIDIQGASALSSLYAPIGTLDGAFVFDDSDHLHRYFTSEASAPLKDAFLTATGVRILGAWSAGARQFTANVPIRTPDDLQGLRMRFPPSPQFLMNAEAMGASAVEVAFEELYLALQQGTVDGQENPINNIAANNIHEVQDVISMSSHQLNSNLVVINEATWTSLSPEQQAALQASVDKAVLQVPTCVKDFETTTLEDWKDQQDDRGRRGRRPGGVPDEGRSLPSRELLAGAGHGPRGHPLDRAVDPDVAPAAAGRGRYSHARRTFHR